MKKILFILLSFLSTYCIAQNTNYHRWKEIPSLVIECDAFGRILYDENGKPKLMTPKPYSNFMVTNKKNADTLIATFTFWLEVIPKTKSNKFRVSNTKFLGELNLRNEVSLFSNNDTISKQDIVKLEQERKFFLISKGDLEGQTNGIYDKSWRFVVGASTLPLKLRVNNFNFAEKVNIGSSFGYRKRTNSIKDNFWSFLLNLGLSVNNLDNESIRTQGVTPVDNIASLSLGAGTIFSASKAQIGLFVGYDFLSQSNWIKYRWIYNKRFWVGIGIGINIFDNEPSDKSPAKEKAFNK